jgi:hypothetical protein
MDRAPWTGWKPQLAEERQLARLGFIQPGSDLGRMHDF